ncbi:MAG: response regulator [Alphaproteobacteria bacterium]|nr:response regulator [Alphaproteobacteria bacterium]
MTRVLIIDDDKDVRQTVAGMLAKSDHEIIQAGNGAEGMARIRENPPTDVVIVDLIMPEMEGIETIREVRRIDAEIPIIAMSGGGRMSEVDYLSAALKLGADYALRKPFRKAELLDLLMKLPGVRNARASSAEPRRVPAVGQE